MLAFFGYLGHEYHDYKFWFQVETQVWHQHIGWGEHTLRVVLWMDRTTEKAAVFNAVLIIMFAVAVVGIALVVADRLPIPVIVFAVLMVLLPVISPAESPRPRFVWTALPIFIGAAGNCRGHLLAGTRHISCRSLLPDRMVAAPSHRAGAVV